MSLILVRYVTDIISVLPALEAAASVVARGFTTSRPQDQDLIQDAASMLLKTLSLRITRFRAFESFHRCVCPAVKDLNMQSTSLR